MAQHCDVDISSRPRDLTTVPHSDTNWYATFGELIEHLESPGVPRRIVAALSVLVNIDLATVFADRRRQCPLLLFDNFPGSRAQQGLKTYLEHTYVLNPVYQAHLRGVVPGVYRIRELAPDGYFDSAAYKAGYIHASDSEEIGFVTRNWPRGMEEVDILISLDEAVTGEISIYRLVADGGFSEVDLARLREVYPVISACLRVYWRGYRNSILNAPNQVAPADTALDNFGVMKLTRREREVIRLVLGGHSSASISQQLRISVTTVKTHRKHAYDKLDVCTQAQLFSQFLDFAKATERR